MSPRSLLALLRPRHWTKNLVCVAPLVFADRLSDPASQWQSALTFVAFSLASSAGYAANDVLDRAADRVHPLKRTRPVASGALAPKVALVAAAALAAGAIAVAAALGPAPLVLVVLFLMTDIAYSVWLKHITVLDVLVIGSLFALRVEAGIVALGAPASSWIILTVFFGALFLAFAKRRAELAAAPPASQRRALDGYSIPVLDMLLVLSATTAVLGYALYAVTVQRDEVFLVTVPAVVYGIARYLVLVLTGTRSEDPVEVFTSDLPLAASVGVWVLLSVAVLYLR